MVPGRRREMALIRRCPNVFERAGFAGAGFAGQLGKEGEAEPARSSGWRWCGGLTPLVPHPGAWLGKGVELSMAHNPVDPWIGNPAHKVG